MTHLRQSAKPLAVLPIDSARWLTRSLPWLVVGGLALAAAAAVLAQSGFNGDVKYSFGTWYTAQPGGVTISELFMARPFIYRLFVAAIMLVGWPLPFASAAWVLAMKAILALTSATACLVLGSGLSRHLTRRTSWFIAIIVCAALVIAPPYHLLQPDWLAVIPAVAAIGFALLRNAPLAVITSGVTLWLTIAIKVSTGTLAVIALIIIALFSWRRAIWTALTCGITTLGWLAATWVWQRWEITWITDQAKMSQPRFASSTPGNLTESVVNVALVSPIVWAAPAAVLALALSYRQRSRLRVILVCGAIAVLSLLSPFVQAQWGFGYHYAALPVLAAAAWAVALGLAPAARVPLLLGTPLLAASAAILLAQPLPWRKTNFLLATMIMIGLTIGQNVAVAWVWRRQQADPAEPRNPNLPAAVFGLGLLVVAASLVGSGIPTAKYNFNLKDSAVSNSQYLEAEREDQLSFAVLRERIGRNSPVMYLAFGDINYALQNPTNCRYPSPQWLARASVRPEWTRLRSYRDNLLCFDNTNARYLIWQISWARPNRLPRELATRIDREFDCSQRIDASRGLWVCPRRPGR